jgi:hypothetical protein
VDGQAVVDQVGGEHPAEVVGGEAAAGELRVLGGDLVADSGEHGVGRVLGLNLVALADVALEQERLGVGGDAFVDVVAGGQRDGPLTVASETANDAGDHVEQLRRHRDSLNSKMIFQAGSDQLRCY